MKWGENMKDRIKEIRKHYNLSQEQFGARIGITRASVSQIEKGTNGASNATMLNICREFNINRQWLETGSGSMFCDLSRAEMAANMVGNAIASGDDFVLSTFIALGQLTPQQWAIVKDFVDKIKSST